MPGITDRLFLFTAALRILASALVPLCLAFSSKAAESPIVIYAESSALDSRIGRSATGIRIEGYASDLARALLAEAGFTAEIRIVPWPRLMSVLQSEPNVLALNMTRTPGRENLFHWIGEIRPVTFQLWGLRERAGELPRTLAEARDLRVSAYRNDVVEQYLLSEGFSDLIYVSENYDSMAMLQRRRIDLIPYSQDAMSELMSRQNDIQQQLIPLIDLEAISTAHYIVMSKTSDPGFVARVRSAYQALVDSGEFDQILNGGDEP